MTISKVKVKCKGSKNVGISSNQARFLALTSRQVDLEHRIQQICQRRLRLSSELENVATSYNNKISNRQLYAMNTANSGISKIQIGAYGAINDIKDTNGNPYLVIGLDKASKYNSVSFLSGSIYINSGADQRIIAPSDAGLSTGTNTTQEQMLDACLKGGLLSIVTLADEFTQSKVNINNTTVDYEMKDWRTIPALADELYGGDDVDAENKYDKTIAEINAQDKKLQLEQTSIEVEYKAVTSEKESVKKILDTNATASFKYFS